MIHPCPDWLAAAIGPDGRVPFDRFVELALYDPDHGYYEGRRAPIGEGGDFVTGSSLDSSFAAAIVDLLEDLAGSLPSPVQLIEVGAGAGSFMAAAEAEIDRRGMDASLIAVERSDRQRARIRAATAAVEVLSSVDELPARVDGIVFSYELYDALPFKRLIVTEDGSLAEWIVVVNAGQLEIELEPAPTEVTAALAGVDFLEVGQELEWTAGAAELHRRLASRLGSGLILSFDYGARRRALYSPVGRRAGTAQAHRDHRAHRGLLEAPGEQDLTCHVDFETLERVGSELELHTLGLWSQGRFLIDRGHLRRVQEEGLEPAVRRNRLRLIEPGGMGDDLRVLVQGHSRDRESLSKLFISKELKDLV